MPKLPMIHERPFRDFKVDDEEEERLDVAEDEDDVSSRKLFA
jgi:hypothetical protein